MSNQRITELTQNTAPLPTDLGVMVTDPAGTPETEKATLGAMLKGGYGITVVSSSATPTPTGNWYRNELRVTALADNATIAAPTGTAVAGNLLKMTITATGATRTVDYNAIYDTTSAGFTELTSLDAGQTGILLFEYIGSDWVQIAEPVII